MRDKISKKLGSIPPPAVTTVSSSSNKSGGSGKSQYDQKRHDEQMKSIKEMISKSKVGDSHMRKEEE
jgi:NAD-dependent DNA ligase